MQCRCGECDGLPRAEFMEKLEVIREAMNCPLIINSGYRCAKYNQKVAYSGPDGPHVLGLAADIRIYGERAYWLIDIALKTAMTGIGVKQFGAFETRYVHLDCVPPGGRHPRPWIWSY